MFKIPIIVLLILGLASLACGLSSDPSPTAAPAIGFQPTDTPAVQVITNTPAATVTNLPPTNTPFQFSGGNGSNSGSGSSCQVQISWPTYTVQRGDTLAQIARRVNSDVTTLSNANCLTNPNQLEVGQVLHVPRTPVTPTRAPTLTVAAPTTPAVNTLGWVSFSEYVRKVGNDVFLAPDKTLTLSYPEAGAGLHHVDFLVRSPDGQVGNVLGSDSNLSDGATLTWTVPTSFNGFYIYARGFSSPSQPVQESHMTRVFTTVVDEGTLRIEPHVAVDGDDYILQAGETVTVTYEGARTDLARAEFALFDPATDGWTTLGVDTNLPDGASIQWVVPQTLNSHVILATTYGSNGVQYQKTTSGNLSLAASD